MAERTSGFPDYFNCSEVETIQFPSNIHILSKKNATEEEFKEIIAGSTAIAEIIVTRDFLPEAVTPETIATCPDNVNEIDLNNLITQFYPVHVVGYSDEGRYYLVKSSLGTGYADQGFGKISMDHSCGIKRSVTYANIYEAWIPKSALILLMGLLVGLMI